MRVTLFVSKESKIVKFLFDLSIFLFCLAIFMTFLIVINIDSLPGFVVFLIYLGFVLSGIGLIYLFLKIFQNQFNIGKYNFDIDDNNIKITSNTDQEIFLIKDLGPKIEVSKNANNNLKLLNLKGKKLSFDLLKFDNIQEIWDQIEPKISNFKNTEYSLKVELKNYSVFVFYWSLLSVIWVWLDYNYFQLGFSTFLLLLFGYGCFEYIFKPLYNFWGTKLNTIENIISLSCILPFIIHSLFFVLVPHFLNQEELFLDCKEFSPLRACYKISEDSCSKLWDKTKIPCENQVRENMNLEVHPTLLVGPQIRRCRESIYHKSLKYMQRIDSPELCTKYFKSVSAPDR